MSKYEPRPALREKPLLVLGISDVIVLEGDTRVPTSTHHISAWGKWVRDVAIADDAPARIKELSEVFEIVWASEWGHNAHTAFRAVLDLPETPWAFLPVQFDKLATIRAYADGWPWVWVDDELADLAAEPPICADGVVIRVDPRIGISGLIPADLLAAVQALGSPNATAHPVSENNAPNHKE
ncbi:hypothetical protein GCM10022381_17820 [Leifsonia kafniensis]|uniref:Uncharacterized protein n=1 Tax=Leifsonia kafniensis TaxID=475957 RepID=A0ABP7KFY1_9MICO